MFVRVEYDKNPWSHIYIELTKTIFLQGHECEKDVNQAQTCPPYNSYQAQTNWSPATNQQHHHDAYTSPNSGYEAPKEIRASQLISSHSPASEAPRFPNYDDYQQLMHQQQQQQQNLPNQRADASPEHSPNHRILDDRLAYQEQQQQQQPVLSNPESYFYQNNDRCHYTCEVLDTRLPQVGNMAGYTEVADLEMPPYVDYTLVGMLCSSGEEEQQQQPQQLPVACQQQPVVHGYAHHH